MNIGNIGPNILLSMRAQPMRWHVVLSELCDNSFDADASRVELKFGPRKVLEVIDDGNGCDNIERMLTLGDHYRHPTTRLGRWGVGLKEASCWLWGELIVKTSHKGTVRCASIDWSSLAKQDDWNVPDPTSDDSGDFVGTQLMFRGVSRKFPDYVQLQGDLGYTFAPALWSGKQIKFTFPRRKPVTCAAWTMPDIEDIVQDRFDVNGKRVKLTAGIVGTGVVNQRPGFSVSHGHRIILNTALGSKNHSVSRICGIIELDAAWVLSKNKTEVVDADQDGLEDEIFERCQAILIKSSHQAEVIRNNALENKISESLRAILVEQKKAKRGPPKNKSGTIKPVGSTRKVRMSRHTQPGDRVMGKEDIGQMKMEWETRSDKQLGRVDIPGNRIYLNDSHPRLAYHRKNGNSDALVDNCMTLLSFAAIESEQRERLLFAREYDGFLDALSGVLYAQQVTDDTLCLDAVAQQIVT